MDKIVLQLSGVPLRTHLSPAYRAPCTKAIREHSACRMWVEWRIRRTIGVYIRVHLRAERSAISTTLDSSMARVIGPTPPGFGV